MEAWPPRPALERRAATARSLLVARGEHRTTPAPVAHSVTLSRSEASLPRGEGGRALAPVTHPVMLSHSEASLPRGEGGTAPASVDRAVLVLAHGAAEEIDALEAYYAHILHGRKPSPERLAGLRDRYLAIGGRSPLNSLIRAQAAGLATHLRRLGLPLSVYVGFQHTPPFISDTVQAMAGDGIREAIVLVMTPYYSPLGVGRYIAEVERAAGSSGADLRMVSVKSWSDEPGFLGLLECRLRSTLAPFRAIAPRPLHVVFTAHSLPARARSGDDPYVAQYGAVTRELADRLRLDRWSACYQSASETGEPWLGPDILEELEAVARSGARSVVACPTSFTADNLEVLYDLGLASAERARVLGLAYTSVSPFNLEPAFPQFLATLVARSQANPNSRKEGRGR
ncbi:MAG: ferrochelatase [Chloroflexi bacterium]|nr:ferrochelatase [Chloroflexota bacterium]